MKEFKCSDMGYTCDWTTRDESLENVENQAYQHGREHHGLTDITEDIKNKVRSKIRDMKQSNAA